MPSEPTLNRPLSLPPRSGGLSQRIWATLGFLLFAGLLVAMVVFTGPALVSDWQVRGSAQPAEQGRITEGSCSTKLVLAICNVTLANRTAAGTVTRAVNYVFTDLHFGDYSAEVLADPARPDLITTDLALEKLWNRTLTFLVGAGALLAFLVLPILAVIRNRRAARDAAV